MASYSLAELAEKLHAGLVGDGEIIITGLATLQSAKAGELSFLSNSAYLSYLPSTSASAVIIHPDDRIKSRSNYLLSHNPYLAYAKASHLFENKEFLQQPDIHPTVVIDESAQVDPTASIAAQCVISSQAVIAKNVCIGPGCVVGVNSSIAEGTRVYASVTIYHGVTIGRNCIIHSGAVLGSDGFGFARQHKQYIKIAQLGGVIIGDEVEIGANTTIDRGALDNTVIEDGVKLDNQIQIAHNVKIGKNSAMAGCVGVAGSTIIGHNCTFGGGAGVLGHLKIVDDVHVNAMVLVNTSITEPGVYAAGTGISPLQQWRKNAVRFRHLDSLARRVSELEKLCKSLKKGGE